MSIWTLLMISLVTLSIGFVIGFAITRHQKRKRIAQDRAETDQIKQEMAQRKATENLRQRLGTSHRSAASPTSSPTARSRGNSTSDHDPASTALHAAILLDHSATPVRTPQADGHGSYETGGGSGGGSYSTGGSDSSYSSSSSSSSDSSSSSSSDGGGGGGD